MYKRYLLTGTMLSSIYPKAFMDSNITAAVPACQLRKKENKIVICKRNAIGAT